MLAVVSMSYEEEASNAGKVRQRPADWLNGAGGGAISDSGKLIG